MHKFLVCLYNSQDFAQTQEYFAWSHDRETMTFRNSDSTQLTVDSKVHSEQLASQYSVPTGHIVVPQRGLGLKQCFHSWGQGGGAGLVMASVHTEI